MIHNCKDHVMRGVQRLDGGADRCRTRISLPTPTCGNAGCTGPSSKTWRRLRRRRGNCFPDVDPPDTCGKESRSRLAQENRSRLPWFPTVSPGYRVVFAMKVIETIQSAMQIRQLSTVLARRRNLPIRLPDHRRQRHSLPEGRAAMIDSRKNMSCEEFQAQMADLIGSGRRCVCPSPRAKLRPLPSPVQPISRPSRRQHANCFRLRIRQIACGNRSSPPSRRKRAKPAPR